MSKRAELRAQYIEAWETMDAEKLVSAVAEGFEFDDPTDPEPITTVHSKNLKGYKPHPTQYIFFNELALEA